MKKAFSILFPAQFHYLKTNWKEAWHSPVFKRKIIFTVIILGLVSVFISRFFNYAQGVVGYQINDTFLNKISARNASLATFLTMYCFILLCLINLSVYPHLFLKFLQAYCLMTLLRILSIYFIPLEPEQSIIPLEDPLIGKLFYNDNIITKDLFFSGHVATMTLLSFAIPFRPLKYFFVGGTVLVTVFILMQHVHYTIDVLAAPFFAWICFRLTKFYF